MKELLDHVVWRTLAGAHAHFAVGGPTARRYAAGFSPIVAFASLEAPDFAALAAHCGPGEHLYCDGWAGAPPAGWRIDEESTMFKMTWEGACPAADPIPEAVPLEPRHAAQALELARLTRPGPFGPRTIELGEYFGCFEGDRLVAMAGERFAAAPFREISGVCTHPDFRGRGFANRLMMKLVHRQMRRGERPFLHVMRENRSAHDLYARMGFRDYRESPVRVIERTAAAAGL